MRVAMSEASGVFPVTAGDRSTSCEWQACLRAAGVRHDKAIRHVHDLTRRAARQQLIRMPHVWEELGAVRAEEIIEAAADEATMAVLHNLDGFEGRSRFTTWVYKFGVWHAASEARRALWRDRAFVLDNDDALVDGHPLTPESSMEARDLSGAVAVAIRTTLTAHQRRVVMAQLVDEVPIDVLAERLGTSRNALYKALHDARVRLRGELVRRGYLHDSSVLKAAAR
jgi:RNA polymerase sigma-70 factor (ECF subfamily)